MNRIFYQVVICLLAFGLNCVRCQENSDTASQTSHGAENVSSFNSPGTSNTLSLSDQTTIASSLQFESLGKTEVQWSTTDMSSLNGNSVSQILATSTIMQTEIAEQIVSPTKNDVSINPTLTQPLTNVTESKTASYEPLSNSAESVALSSETALKSFELLSNSATQISHLVKPTSSLNELPSPSADSVVVESTQSVVRELTISQRHTDILNGSTSLSPSSDSVPTTEHMEKYLTDFISPSMQSSSHNTYVFPGFTQTDKPVEIITSLTSLVYESKTSSFPVSESSSTDHTLNSGIVTLSASEHETMSQSNDSILTWTQPLATGAIMNDKTMAFASMETSPFSGSQLVTTLSSSEVMTLTLTENITTFSFSVVSGSPSISDYTSDIGTTLAEKTASAAMHSVASRYESFTMVSSIHSGYESTTMVPLMTSGYESATMVSSVASGNESTTMEPSIDSGNASTTIATLMTSGYESVTMVSSVASGYESTTMEPSIDSGNASTTMATLMTSGYESVTMVSSVASRNESTTMEPSINSGYESTTMVPLMTSGYESVTMVSSVASRNESTTMEPSIDSGYASTTMVPLMTSRYESTNVAAPSIKSEYEPLTTITLMTSGYESTTMMTSGYESSAILFPSTAVYSHTPVTISISETTSASGNSIHSTDSLISPNTASLISLTTLDTTSSMSAQGTSSTESVSGLTSSTVETTTQGITVTVTEPSSTVQNLPVKSSSGLSTGSKVAIGVLVPLAVIVAVILGILLYRRYNWTHGGFKNFLQPGVHYRAYTNETFTDDDVSFGGSWRKMSDS